MIEQFNEAIDIAKKNIDFFSDDDKLLLYKFYKQATIGDINVKKPSFIKLKESKKWKAWNSVKGLSKNDAMKQYINFINQKLSN